jgi:hypothetical protein
VEAKTQQVAGNGSGEERKVKKIQSEKGKSVPRGHDGTEAPSDRASRSSESVLLAPMKSRQQSKDLPLASFLSVAQCPCGKWLLSFFLRCIRVYLCSSVVPTLWGVRSNRKYSLLDLVENTGR